MCVFMCACVRACLCVCGCVCEAHRCDFAEQGDVGQLLLVVLERVLLVEECLSLLLLLLYSRVI